MSVSCILPEWDTAFLGNAAFTSKRNRELAGIISGRGILSITELINGIEVRSNSFIGRVDLGDFTIHVLPKLNGMPLVRLLSYAYGLRDLSLFDKAQYPIGDAGLFDLLSYALHGAVEQMLRRGTAKGYRYRSGDLAAIRGRIDFARVAALGGITAETLPCHYHRRESDILLNQVLLAGLRLAHGMANDINLKHALSKSIGILAESVSPVKLDGGVLARAKRTVSRMTDEYEPVISIIEMLYTANAPVLETQDGSFALPGFFFDMNLFFEALVSKLLKTLPDEYTMIDQYHLKHLFAYDPRNNPNKRRDPVPRPDFAIRRNNRVTHLLDAKYRDIWAGGLPNNMLYQLAIYALSGVGGYRATIIYPALTDEPKPQYIDIFDPATGRKQACVGLVPVNLMKISDLLSGNKMREISCYMTRIAMGDDFRASQSVS